MFKPGIYTTWLNNNGDKVKDLGGGSFAPEFQKKYPALYKEFVINGPYSNAVGLRPQRSQPTLAMNCRPDCTIDIASLVENPTEIYLLGMDIYSNNDRVNNVYKGNQGYMRDTGNAVPPVNFVYQHQICLNYFLTLHL